MSFLRNDIPYEPSKVDDFQYEPSSSGSSCSSCCDYHSDDSIPEWDNSVQDNGELFYVKCSPILSNLNLTNESPDKCNVNGSKSSKLSTFLRKRKAKKHAKKLSLEEAGKSEEIRVGLKAGDWGSISLEDICESSAAILYLNVQSVENCESNICESTIYHFPDVAQENIVNSIKGTLLTLYHLLPKLVSERPESSTILIRDELVHLTYIGDDKELMIIALPDASCSLLELKQTSQNIKRFLCLKFGSLHKCFINSDNYVNLNQFFGNLFIKILKNSNDLNSSKSLTENEILSQIEDMFFLPSLLPIPVALKTKIHEKLNEIEANDFGDLSEDHYGCQRLFTLIGTCFYYKGYLIETHLNCEDLVDVHVLLRYSDILDLTVNSSIESLVMWQEIFLSSGCLIEGNASKKRWFLLIIGKEQGLLITVFESGGCSVSSEGPVRPDELYVEQIQEILNDILHYNLPKVLDRSTDSISVSTQKSTPRKSTENLTNVHAGSLKKLRGGSEFNPPHHSSSVHISGNEGDSFSESLSRTTSSLFSDENVPVLGRRAQRMKQLNNSGSIYSLSHSTLSDSDRSDYDTTQGSSHSSSLSDANKRHFKESSGRKSKIIHGEEKALFFNLNVQSSRSVILCSLNGFQPHLHRRWTGILKNFKLSVQKIHEIFLKNKPSSIGKFHRNELSVKEYGILFEQNDDGDDTKRNIPATYWIVGRSFDKSYLGEVYVCYEDNTPQNLVEIAFRLAMSS